MAGALLSKSRFISGLHCPLRLWYQCYEPKLAAEISPGQQVIFDTGHEVGRLATKLFPKGSFIEEDHMHHREAEIITAVLLKNKRVDVLERVGCCKWNLIEVKSSTSVTADSFLGADSPMLQGPKPLQNGVILPFPQKRTI